MNYGPLIFLAAFLSLAASWFGFVLTPSLQLGSLQQTNTIGGGSMTYPLARPGLAREGAEVYRANGCAYCHSQQILQSGTAFEVAITDPGTNRQATLTTLQQVATRSSTPPETLLANLPATVWRGASRSQADAVSKQLNATSAKSALLIVPFGPDIERGWGKRRSVAEDFLYDTPVMLGTQRTGPDLANVGVRLPDPNWHLRHLFNPRLEVQNSTMPPYRFLFETRKINGTPSPNALPLTGPLAPPAGYEVVPTHDAKALVAYLLSLRSDAPLFSSPLSAGAAPPVADTNAPNAAAANSTNTTPTAPTAK